MYCIWCRHTDSRQTNIKQNPSRSKAIELDMLGISLKHIIPSDIIRQQTEVNDAVETITHLKLNWVEHVARMDDERSEKMLNEDEKLIYSAVEVVLQHVGMKT